MSGNDIIYAFGEIGRAFVTDLSVWWILTPVFILWISMEFYFGEYKKELIGFSSALANGISLGWVSITSIRIYILGGGEPLMLKFNLLMFFLLYGVFVMYSAFMHKFSPRAMNFFAAPSLVYFMSVLAVLWGQQLLGVTPAIAVALLVIFVVVYFSFFIIRRQLGLLGEIEAVKNAGEMSNE